MRNILNKVSAIFKFKIVLMLLLSIVISACQPAEPITISGEGDIYNISLELDAPTMGFRHATIHVYDKENELADKVETVTLLTEMTAMAMGMPEAEAVKVDEGVFEVNEIELFNMLGEWYITVIVDGDKEQPIQLEMFDVTP